MNKVITHLLLSTILGASFALFTGAKVNAQQVLTDIEKTGTLRVGVRKDAAPLGYEKDGKWQGICVKLMEDLQTQLSEELKRPIKLEMLETNLDENSEKGRFASIRKKRVHVECGPNTITKRAATGTTFSLPFMYTGTYLMMKPTRKLLVNPSGFLEGLKIGVLEGSLTEKFIASRYQLAQQRLYQGRDGRALGVKEAVAGITDAFASDGILLIGEAQRQGIAPEAYSIEPPGPLTCISYGMILPVQDEEWKKTINKFLLDAKTINDIVEIFREVDGPASPYINVTIVATDQCSGL